jgi:drug/metabolite transporter (DMT)-like permease
LAPTRATSRQDKSLIETGPVTTARLRATIASLLSAVAFGFSGLPAKVAYDAGFTPLQVTAVRIVLTAIVLLAFVVPFTGLPKLSSWRLVLSYALLGVIGSPLLYFVAVSRIPVGVAMVLEFLAPVLVALWIRFVRRTRLPRAMWLGTALALVGLAMIAQLFDAVRFDLVGTLAGLGAAVGTAAYYLLGEHAAKDGDPMALTTGGMVVGAVLISIVSPPWTLPWAAMTTPTALGPVWLGLVLLALVSTAFAYVAGILALRHLPSAAASVLGLVEPLVATLAAWLLLGQVLTVVQVVGAVVLLAGAAIVQIAAGRRIEPDTPPSL